MAEKIHYCPACDTAPCNETLRLERVIRDLREWLEQRDAELTEMMRSRLDNVDVWCMCEENLGVQRKLRELLEGTSSAEWPAQERER